MAYVDLLKSTAVAARYYAAVELCAAADQMRMTLRWLPRDAMAVQAATQRLQTADSEYSRTSSRTSGTSRSSRVTTAPRATFDLSDTGQL